MDDSLFTEDEMQALIMATVQGHEDEGGATAAQVQLVVDWAEGVRVDAGLLRLMLRGEVMARVQENGELLFRRVA